MYTKSTSVGEDKLVYMEEHTYITTYTYMYVGHLGNGNYIQRSINYEACEYICRAAGRLYSQQIVEI